MKAKQFNGEIYFHVLGPDRRLRDGRVVEPGHTYHALQSRNYRRFTKPMHCSFGMHASHGLWYAAYTNEWVCLVRLWEKLDYPKYSSKGVAMRRHVIAMRQNKYKKSIVDKFELLPPRGYQDGFATYGGSNLQKVVDWVLEKPYKGIVSPS